MGESVSQSEPLPRLLVSVTEAAQVLNISRSYAYELVAAGAIIPVRLGRRVLIPIAAIEQLIADSRDESSN